MRKATVVAEMLTNQEIKVVIWSILIVY